MKILLSFMMFCAVITAFFGDIQKAIFLMLMAIFIQGSKDE
jgi:hypothetical protein